MKKNKFQKGKSLAIAVFGLAAVAVVGVGFSSWVIQLRDTKAINDVAVQVADTEDDVVAIVPEDGWFTDNSTKFVFDSANVTTGFVQGKEVKAEVLTRTIGFTLYKSEHATFTGLNAKFAINAANENYETSITKGYIETALSSQTQILDANGTARADILASDSSTVIVHVTSTKTLAANNTTGTYKGMDKFVVTLQFGFAWGKAFNYKNPTTYFNETGDVPTGSLTRDVGNALESLKTLSGIDSTHDGSAVFTLTLSPDTIA